MKKSFLALWVTVFVLAIGLVVSAASAIKLSKENANLRDRIAAQSMTVMVYNQDNELIKDLEVSYINGESLEKMLQWMDDNEMLSIQLQASTYGAWIEEVEGIGGVTNYYWALYSDSNVACKLPASDPNNYTEYDGYCSYGISDITVEYGDTFILRYIGY